MEKKFMLHRFFAFMMALIFCLCLVACSSKEDETPTPTSTNTGDNIADATQFSFTLTEGEEQIIENLRFGQDVVVSGYNGSIVFANCEFLGNITNTGTGGTSVVLEGSTVAKKCIITHNDKEATLDSPMPKFMTDNPIDVICEECYGFVIGFGEFAITFNGESYSVENAEFFYDLVDGLVPYEGQEIGIIEVGQWWENGEYILCVMAE